MFDRVYHRFGYEITEADFLLDVVDVMLFVRRLVGVLVVVPDAQAAHLHGNVVVDVGLVRLDVVLLHLRPKTCKEDVSNTPGYLSAWNLPGQSRNGMSSDLVRTAP